MGETVSKIEASYDLYIDGRIDYQDYQAYIKLTTSHGENPKCFNEWAELAQTELGAAGSTIDTRLRRPSGFVDGCGGKPKILSQEAKAARSFLQGKYHFTEKNAAQIFNPDGNQRVDQFDLEPLFYKRPKQIKNYRSLVLGFLELARYYKAEKKWSLPEIVTGVYRDDYKPPLKATSNPIIDVNENEVFLNEIKQLQREEFAHDEAQARFHVEQYVEAYISVHGKPESYQEIIDSFMRELGDDYIHHIIRREQARKPMLEETTEDYIHKMHHKNDPSGTPANILKAIDDALLHLANAFYRQTNYLYGVFDHSDYEELNARLKLENQHWYNQYYK